MRVIAGIFLLAVMLGAATVIKTGKDAKRAAWPPKVGIKTPGIQIPMTDLKAEAEFTLTGAASGIAFADKIYVAVREPGGLVPVIVKTNKVEDSVAGLKNSCGGAVSGFGGIWAASCSDSKLAKYDAKTKKFVATVEVAVADRPRAVATTDDSLWVLSDSRSTLSRVDPESSMIAAEVRLPAGCNSILSAAAALWVTCPSEDKLLKVNPQTNLVEQRIEVAGEPIDSTFGEGSIWVLARREGKVIRVDPKTNKATATIELKIPAMDGTIAFGEGAVWVSSPEFPITRIDPASDKVMQQFGGEGGGNIYAGAGSVWLADATAKMVRRYDPKRIKATLAE